MAQAALDRLEDAHRGGVVASPGAALRCPPGSSPACSPRLEQQWDNASKPSTFAIGGITYAFSDAAPAGKKIVADSVKIAGQPLNPVGTYRVATNNFVQQGGDGFSVFAQATDVVPGPIDLDALESYLNTRGTVSAPTPGRITKQ